MAAADGGGYPPPAFHFQVRFSDQGSSQDTSFQEVSGIEATVETEDYREGGGQGAVYKLPARVTYPNLVLKRGIAATGSPLVQWCRAVFESDLSTPVTTKQVWVMLLDEKGEPMRTWSFQDAFPVRWVMDPFHSAQNNVALETVELSYSSSQRED